VRRATIPPATGHGSGVQEGAKFVQDEVAKGNTLAVVETDENGEQRIRETVLVG
jgi:hypothetical protein